MKTYRITTPVPGWTGIVGAIHFANGVAFCNEAEDAALYYFRTQGYLVEDVEDLSADDTAGAGDATQVDALKQRIAELEAQLAAPPETNKAEAPKAATPKAGAK